MKPICKEIYQNSRYVCIEYLKHLLWSISQNALFIVSAAQHTRNISILRRLSKSGAYWVREMVALNQRTPLDILIILSQDEESIVHTAARTNITYLKYKEVKIIYDLYSI